ncbi:MAG: PAS domain S-box protein [Nitrospira sp.]|nr:PAS domain S-box protein [Nitrospira sp.]
MSDEYLGFAFEDSGIGLWDWNVATNSVQFSGGWKDMFGYAQDEGSYPFHPDDRPKFMDALQQCIQDETPMFDNEHRMRCKNGSYKWVVERNKVMAWTPDGKPLRVLGTYTDITERKALERRLTLQHEVANVLASNVSGVDDAIAAILQPVCEALGWDEGLLWVVDESAQRLRCHATWITPSVGLADYGAASREMTFLSGVGLPGRVWASAQPAWITDVTRDQNFPRAALAKQAGFHTAAAFPIKLTGRVHAVLEFFHHDVMPTDPSLLITFQAVADQLSQLCSRKRTEELLRSSEDKLRQALGAANIGLWEWNTETNEVRFSREWKGQLGYEEAELPDSFDTWEQGLHPDDRARAVAYAQVYIVCPEGDYQQEFRLRHKDGTYRWIEARASFVKEPDGRCMRLLGSHTDITARKKAEAARVTLQYAIDHGMEGFALLDEHGSYLYMNEAHARMYGYEVSQLVGRSWKVLYDSDQIATIEATAYPTIQAEQFWRGELIGRSRAGMPVHVEVGLQHLPQEGSAHGVLLCTCRDITARKQMEAELVEREERLRLFIEHQSSLADGLSRWRRTAGGPESL